MREPARWRDVAAGFALAAVGAAWRDQMAEVRALLEQRWAGRVHGR